MNILLQASFPCLHSIYLSSGVDYFATPIIFVTLPAGTTEECIVIQIIDDSLIEGNETFQIDVIPIFDIGTIISNAVVTIIDDDG